MKGSDIKCIVNPRRTVKHDGVVYRGGQPVELPRAEAERLVALGFVSFPGADLAFISEGPQVITGNAAKVEEKAAI